MISHILLSLAAHVLPLIWVAGMWQGALFVGLALLLLRLVPQASAALRHTALVVLFVLTLAMPCLSLLRPTRPAHASHSLQISVWVAIAIAAWWAAATLYRTISLLIAWQYLREVRRKALPVQFNLEALGLDVPRRPLVCTSAFVDTPVIVGFFRPVLLLPEWLAPTLSAEEFRQIALHECEHLRRRDDWTNLCLQLALTLFPLNPALLWLNRRIGVQRELACDAAVVASTARPTDYAASLVNIASQRRFANTLRFALAAWGRQSEISQRVHALLEQPPKGTRLQQAAATGLAISLLLASVAGLAFAPQPVSLQAPLVVATASRPDRPSVENIAQAVPTPLDPSAAHFLPASYTAPPQASVHPAPIARVLPKRKRRLQHPAGTTYVLQTEEAFSRKPARPFDVETQNPSVVPTPEGASIRAVPVLFVPTYLAVPVSGGWIMIQL